MVKLARLLAHPRVLDEARRSSIGGASGGLGVGLASALPTQAASACVPRRASRTGRAWEGFCGSGCELVTVIGVIPIGEAGGDGREQQCSLLLVEVVEEGCLVEPWHAHDLTEAKALQ